MAFGINQQTDQEMPTQEKPALAKGDIWRTSQPAVAREIVDLNPRTEGAQTVKYRTRYGEFECSESEFRFWIERRFAWPSGSLISSVE
jgi:hypothetical protein